MYRLMNYLLDFILKHDVFISQIKDQLISTLPFKTIDIAPNFHNRLHIIDFTKL